MYNALKVYNTREIIKILMKNGWEFVSSTGGHKKFKKDAKTLVINHKVNRMVWQRLVKENNIVL